MKRFVAAVMLLFFALSPASGEAVSYDVVIAGGGTGGISAAIQASRMGLHVLVVEPTNMLGGQATAAGVSTMDDMSRVRMSGVYREFMDKVKAHYDGLKKSMATPYWKEHGKAFEPSVGHAVLAEMAKSADILYHSSVVDVDGDSVQVMTPDGRRDFTAKIIIDATEYGDIMPLAGVRYRSGNTLSPEIDTDRMIQDITWTAVIRKYPGGVPDHLKPKNPLPGYEKARKNYQRYVTKNGFDFRGRYPVKMPVNFISHNAYRAIPDSFTKGSYTGNRRDWQKITKTGVNWGNDYPGAYTWEGRWGVPVKFLEDKDFRAMIEREALVKTLHFIYYMQNDLGESWSVDENEYDDMPDAAKDLPDEWKEVARHMPPIPYVRESRRILGEYTLTSDAIYNNSMSYRDKHNNAEISDAIAIGGYILDLHASDDDDDIESSLGERQASIRKYEPAGAFQVPMRILIPASVDNFIAAEKNLSMSRLASGALRLQPITMMTGQAAGALAAVSILRGVKPREVHALHVQKVLADSGVKLTLAEYSDVREDHKYYGSVQLATLYGLVRPLRFPVYPVQRINSPKGKSTPGIFGVNMQVTSRELAEMIERAEKIMGGKLALPEMKNVTRGEAVDVIIRAMDEI